MSSGKELLEALVKAGFKPVEVKISKEAKEKMANQYKEQLRLQEYARKNLRCPYDETKLVLGGYVGMSGQRTQKLYICPKCHGYIEKDMTKEEEERYQQSARKTYFATKLAA